MTANNEFEPRELLKTLMEENPGATEQEMFQLFMAELKDNPEYSEVIIEEVLRSLRAH